MSWFETIVLAVVQGLTEFIPISSTAHLRIVPALLEGLGWKDPGPAFTAVLQIGTLLAVLWYFWRDVVHILAAMLADLRRRPFAMNHDAQLGWMIAVGTLSIIVFGLLFKSHIETTFRSLYVIAAALATVALLLALAERWVQKKEEHGVVGRRVEQLTWRDAIVVGISQTAALVPGMSRSGVTILGGLSSGLTRDAAARFSFLLSIPAVFAAGVFELFKEREELLASRDQVLKLIVAILVAAVVGYATIGWLLNFLRTRSTWLFIAYRLLLAALLLLLLWRGQISSYAGG